MSRENHGRNTICNNHDATYAHDENNKQPTTALATNTVDQFLADHVPAGYSEPASQSALPVDSITREKQQRIMPFQLSS